MERTELIEAIRKVCEIQNDIRIDMRVRGEGWFFDAAYIFLGAVSYTHLDVYKRQS